MNILLAAVYRKVDTRRFNLTTIKFRVAEIPQIPLITMSVKHYRFISASLRTCIYQLTLRSPESLCIRDAIAVFPLILLSDSDYLILIFPSCPLGNPSQITFSQSLIERQEERNGRNLPAGDVTDRDCCPELELPPLPMFCFLNCFLCFIRRFWNHVFT